MSEHDSKWFHALTGQSEPENGHEHQAKILGDNLRAGYDNIHVDEQHVSEMLTRLRNENLLRSPSQSFYRKNKNWVTGIAAVLAIVVLVPSVVFQQPPGIDEYPVLRGNVDSKSIQVHDLEKTAYNLQKSLTAAGYSPKIYQYRGHLLLSLEVTNITPEIKKILSEYGVSINQPGKLKVELVPLKGQ